MRFNLLYVRLSAAPLPCPGLPPFCAITHKRVPCPRRAYSAQLCTTAAGGSRHKLAGLIVAGTLRAVADAAAIGLIDLPASFGKLRSTSFRADPRLMELLLKEHGSIL
jgi:hypothetical protein